MHQLMRGPIAELFDERQLVRDVSGAGNNWAHGYCGVWMGGQNQHHHHQCNLFSTAVRVGACKRQPLLHFIFPHF
jgi:hypothetical protein